VSTKPTLSKGVSDTPWIFGPESKISSRNTPGFAPDGAGRGVFPANELPEKPIDPFFQKMVTHTQCIFPEKT
jgi:hypothetical protein